MPYDNLISRTDAAALIPEEVSNEMLANLANESAVRRAFKSVPVGSKQTRFPVLSALPVAYWVNGDTGLKQTTEVNWDNKYLNIEEIACIVPIPENVIDDNSTPIWSQVQPLMEQAVGRTLDSAVFFGINAPGVFPQNIVAAATAAGNHIARGGSNAAAGGLVDSHGDLLSLVESGGFSPTDGIAARSFRGQVRKARDADGNRYQEIEVRKDEVEIDGVTYTHPMAGQWPTGSSAAEAVMLDANQFVLGVRQDVTWKLLDQAVIQDNTGAIIYNLPQQDMVAMRVKFRAGWQVANTINYEEQVEANRYPAGVLTAPA